MTGIQTPDPLLGARPNKDYFDPNSLARVLSNTYGDSGESYELSRVVSRRRASMNLTELAEEARTPMMPSSQGVPQELRGFASEIIFVLVCGTGQLFFSFLLGDVTVNQQQFKEALGIQNTALPWLTGAFMTANGLSVILSGSLTDLTPPKTLIVGAFIWLTVWNIVGAFSVTPGRKILFFVMRAMQGLAIGVLVSGSMSILGRVYRPGLRKTRVFSAMAAMAPFGFWLGAIQGGALASHLPWIFGTNAILCGLCCVAAYMTMPTLRPVADSSGEEIPSMRNFDYYGAGCAVLGCVWLLFGLTQGSAVYWKPYTYALIIAGVVTLVAFFFVETRVKRPLIPSRLWKISGFTALMIAYFIGIGTYIGAWQFYAVQFWLRIQHASSMTVALYILPNAIVGVLATWIVSRLMHVVPGHYIFLASMLAFALGPAFFLPQTASTSYWALSMPGIALVTFGPDLSFAAASIFITSNVPRSYQGSAGSLLVTIQNLSSAIMTSIADAIGTNVDPGHSGEIGLKGLRAIWWFALASALVGAVITALGVRIAKEEEKEHVT
ncbi:hypothetical protein AAFC00_004391 [Neodothiora populina]